MRLGDFVQKWRFHISKRLTASTWSVKRTCEIKKKAMWASVWDPKNARKVRKITQECAWCPLKSSCLLESQTKQAFCTQMCTFKISQKLHKVFLTCFWISVETHKTRGKPKGVVIWHFMNFCRLYWTFACRRNTRGVELRARGGCVHIYVSVWSYFSVCYRLVLSWWEFCWNMHMLRLTFILTEHPGMWVTSGLDLYHFTNLGFILPKL